MPSLDCNQVHFAAKEIFQIEGQIHEVSEGRFLELYPYVDVAGLLLIASGKRAEEANSLDAKCCFYISGVAFDEINYFHDLSDKIMAL